MNIFKNKKFIASALTFVLVIAWAGLPLSAKERRGATVEVTMTDGSMVKGELLVVKSDALLVYDPDAGQGKSLDLQQVAEVKLLKESKFLKGLTLGMGVGWAFGIYTYKIVGAGQHDNYIAEMFCYVLPPITGLCGGLLGALVGKSKTFYLVGESPQVIQKNLEQLQRHMREQDAAQPQQQLQHRLHLLWSPGNQNISNRSDFFSERMTFRFIDKISSKDTAIYTYKIQRSYLQENLRTDQFRLEYELTPHLSPSLEFIVSGKINFSFDLNLGFDSIDYGKRYRSSNVIDYEYYYNSLLLGLNWKSVLPSSSRKHIVGFGVAAGPVRVNLDCQDYRSSIPLQKFEDLTWIGKVHLAYDYFYTRNISLGAFFGYQYLRASFPSATFVNDNQQFWPEGENYDSVDRFTRPTEFTFPKHCVKLDGAAFGLRLGLNF